jgi:anaerobic magnesium-protoporphyrin IX monomethyl ester cyclase
MTKRCDILLVGYEEGENLGLRSMASYLRQFDIEVRVEPYDPENKNKILAVSTECSPMVVGFSMIFQRFLPDFADLISYLRGHDVSCHFTMGGHFPSIDSRFVLEYIPGLDSVVRCEGELTVHELLNHIRERSPFDDIPGLTFRSGRSIRMNPPRRLIKDLDTLPVPVRDRCAYKILDVGVSTLLSSRGCFYDCSFCSIRQFYREGEGPQRRSRSPRKVVDEIEMLYKDPGSRVFIFEDDDFYARNKAQKEWVDEFLIELKKRNLDNKIGWRISCRVDDIEEDVLRRMKEAGLLCVYIGIEAGNNTSLRIYNKKYTTETLNNAISILEKIHLYYEFGFMIFNPYCTLDTMREDIEFLKRLGHSGLAVVHFTKMVPYRGTPIEKTLKKQGRLTGVPESPDYGYPDPRLSLMELFLHQAFRYRNFNPQGLVEKLRYMKFYVTLLGMIYPEVHENNNCAEKIEQLIKEANHEFLEKSSMALNMMAERDEEEIIRLWPILDNLIKETQSFEKEMSDSIDRWYAMLENKVKRERSTVLLNAL